MGSGQGWPGLVQATFRGAIHGGPGLMHIEYKIKYKIDGDIPINPDWIRGQLHASVQALQKEIDKKNLGGKHTVELDNPGWKLQAS